MARTTQQAHDSLPLAPSKLIGRQRELATALDLLAAPDVRLLTLTGAPGVGKTALALETARAVDGNVAFVSLDAVSSPDDVADAIARRLGLRKSRDTFKALQSHFGAKPALLVLDSCETALEWAASLAALLDACPGLTVLATSRAALRIRSERCMRIRPLPTPAFEFAVSLSPADLLEYEAIALFVERAHAANADFALTQANARSVAMTCIQLGGLPLAIELAAVHLQSLPVESLMSHLDDGLDALQTGFVDAPERHQSMRSAIAPSYNGLSDQHRRLARTLSVFDGGLDMDATAALASALAEDARLVKRGLEHLADRGLAQAESGTDQQVRYTLLSPVRDFLQEQVAVLQEVDEVAAIHAQVMAAFAERASSAFLSPDLGRWYRRLDDFTADFLRAARWSLDHEPSRGTALRLATSLWRYWLARWHRSLHRAEIVSIFDALIAHRANLGPAAPVTPEWAELLCGTGMVALYRHEHDQAQSLLHESIQVWEQVGESTGYAATLVYWARFLQMHGLDDPRPLLERAIDLLQQHPNPWVLAFALDALAMVAANESDYTTAHTCLDQSYALFADQGNRWGMSISLRSQACLAFLEGDVSTCLSLLEQCVSIQRDLRDGWSLHLTMALMDHISGSPGSDITRSTARDTLVKRDSQAQMSLVVPSRLIDSFRLAAAPAQLDAPQVLTKRELEVVQLIAAGHSNAEIARKLVVTVHTVARHLTHIFQKIGAHNRVEVAAYAIQHRLTTAGDVLINHPP